MYSPVMPCIKKFCVSPRKWEDSSSSACVPCTWHPPVRGFQHPASTGTGILHHGSAHRSQLTVELLNIENMDLTQKCPLWKSNNVILPQKENIIFNSFTLGFPLSFTMWPRRQVKSSTQTPTGRFMNLSKKYLWFLSRMKALPQSTDLSTVKQI